MLSKTYTMCPVIQGGSTLHTPQASHSPSKGWEYRSRRYTLCAGYKNTVRNNHLSLRELVQFISDPSDTELQDDGGSLTPYNHPNKLPKNCLLCFQWCLLKSSALNELHYINRTDSWWNNARKIIHWWPQMKPQRHEVNGSEITHCTVILLFYFRLK